MSTMMEVSFGELKETIIRMRSLVKRTLDVDSDSRTSFHDMGVDGLDWDSFLGEFYSEFGVELEGLNYEDYFTEGVPVKFKDIVLFPYTLVRSLFLFSIGQYNKHCNKRQLTTGDLILSVHAGRFVKREEVALKMVK